MSDGDVQVIIALLRGINNRLGDIEYAINRGFEK